MVIRIIMVVAFILLAPFIGGLFEGIDRKLSARMQRRIGPPLLQPFYDVKKLLNKQLFVVSRGQSLLIVSYFLMMILSGIILFAGSDILMSFFVLSTAAAFLYFSAVVTNSPYTALGGERELLQIMAYEPAVLLTAVGFYLATGSFSVSEIITSPTPAIIKLPGFFFAFVFAMTIKLRKSPFDTATSRHPHQELVKGITTELGARNLALYTIAEWYEIVYLMAVVAIFLINANPLSYILAGVVVLAVYFLEVLIDNTCARMKAASMVTITWMVTFLAAGINLVILMLCS